MKFVVARQRESLVDLFEVAADGVRTEIEFVGYFTVGEAACIKLQHFALAVRKAVDATHL